MKYAIIGTGAIGGYYGSLLVRGGFDVHFLLRGDYEYVKEHGLKIDSKNGNFVLPEVKAYAVPAEMPLCDAAIISLKTTQNRALRTILPYTLKPDGTVILLQNGYGVEKEIAEIMPEASILSGTCHIACTKIGQGHINHMEYGNITLGEFFKDYKPAGITDKLRAFASDFDKAGIKVDLNESVGELRWKKLVWNIPFNGLSSIFNSTTDELMAGAQMKTLIKNIMREVISGALHCGFSLDEKLADTMLKHTLRLSGYKTSMMLDFESGREPEIETMFIRPVIAAKASGFNMILVQALAQMLQFKSRISSDLLT